MLPNGDLQFFDVERTPHSAMVNSVLCCCKAHCISYMFSWCLLSSWENSSYCPLGFSLNLMPLLGLTLMGWHPKFTFSTFTPDPNLQNPHLHKTQIYTNSNLHSSDLHTPKFTQPNIGIPKFTQLKFTQNWTQIYTTQIYKTQIYTKPEFIDLSIPG